MVRDLAGLIGRVGSRFETAQPPMWVWVLGVALLLASLGNVPLWLHLGQLPDVSGWRGLAFGVCFGVWLTAVLVSVLAWLTLWPRVLRGMVVGLLLITAVSSYFMSQYGIVIDSSMLLNVWHTDVREAADLWSGALLLWILGGWGVAWGLWRMRLRVVGWRPRLFTATALFLGGGVVVILSLMLMFQDFASLMRNHKDIRYQINPLNSLYALSRVVWDAQHQHASAQSLTAIGMDARLGTAFVGKQPPVVVLVVGETARAANFSLGGYGQAEHRDTTPVLRALQASGNLYYAGHVSSCGTNTQASVPCLFSHHGKQGHENSKTRFENLLDVFQRAGLAVLWLDNQSGCKGVCDRVPTFNTHTLDDPRYCSGGQTGECWDEVMFSVLDEQIAALPVERKRNGIVVVMHQMGSHGPAYYKRSPPEHKAFLPECNSNALPDCSRSDLVNAYDNSIRYTDYFLGQTIAWLSRQSGPTAMAYVSDHGESLGENNVYLHGLPYALAPDVQKQVPMVWWVSPAMRAHRGWQTKCLEAQTSRALSHDHFFHSVLGLLDIQTEVYQATQDMWAPCH